jgi:hypothetical protein
MFGRRSLRRYQSLGGLHVRLVASPSYILKGSLDDYRAVIHCQQ